MKRMNAGPRGVDIEREADLFAMCLLMPTDMVRTYMEGKSLDLTDDSTLNALAKKFAVTATLAAKRLADLGYL